MDVKIEDGVGHKDAVLGAQLPVARAALECEGVDQQGVHDERKGQRDDDVCPRRGSDV